MAEVSTAADAREGASAMPAPQVAASPATASCDPSPQPGLLKRAASALLTVELVVLAVLVALCAGPKLFGYDTYGVLTGSMRPAFDAGALVFVDKSVTGADLQVGDVAAFDIGDGRICTHRVVATDPDTQTITTKGDANAAEDPNPTAYADVFGRTAGSIPGLGALMTSYEGSKWQWLAAIGAVTVALGLASALLPDKKPSRKK